MRYGDINTERYMGKGNHFKFKRDYGMDVYDEIIKKTKILNGTFKDNEKFTARLIFLCKYSANINLIKSDDRVWKFNGKDFFLTSTNSAKKHWDSLVIKLENIKLEDLYDFELTISKLLINGTYLSYLGKSKNRTLQKHDLVLYKSILHHTKIFDSFNKNYKKLSHRILFLVGDLDIICNNCNSKNHWTFIKNNIVVSCSKCQPKFPSKEWFLFKYKQDAETKYDKYFDNIKSLKTNSKEWYINKYGEVDGKIKYHNRYEEHMIKMCELKKNKYSKISQELFWSINERLEDDESFFYEKNNEYYIRIPEKFNHKSNIFFIDFKYKKKIIEYDGKYWHNNENDCLRDEILNEMGYDVLRISSDEYNRNNKLNTTVNRCLDFLLDNKNDK